MHQNPKAPESTQATHLRVVFGARSPHEGVVELINQCSVNLHASALDCDAIAATREHNGVLKVWWVPSLLGVHANQAQHVPGLVGGKDNHAGTIDCVSSRQQVVRGALKV